MLHGMSGRWTPQNRRSLKSLHSHATPLAYEHRVALSGVHGYVRSLMAPGMANPPT